MSDIDRNRLSYWFPYIADALPADRYPRTAIIIHPAGYDVLDMLDGVDVPGTAEFLDDLRVAAASIGGYPVFWRSDLSAAKHDWEDTCFVESPDDFRRIGIFIDNLGATDSLGGIDVWAVRELLPVLNPIVTTYRGLPIGRERRYHVRDGEIIEHFPYWPVRAITDTSRLGAPLKAIGRISHESDDEVADLSAMASQVGAAIGGEWSVDFMETARGWVCIDMAQWDQSWRPSSGDRTDWARTLMEEASLFDLDVAPKGEQSS